MPTYIIPYRARKHRAHSTQREIDNMNNNITLKEYKLCDIPISYSSFLRPSTIFP